MLVQTPEVQIQDAIRTWVVDSLQFTTNDEKGRVLIEQKGQLYGVDEFTPNGEAISATRPKPPFLVISITSSDIPLGTDDRWVDSNERKQFSGQRRASVAINGYGLPTHGWLSLLGLRYTEVEGPVSLVPRAGISDLSELISDDYIEARYMKEFETYYTVKAPDDYTVDVARYIEFDFSADGLTADIDQTLF